MQYLSFERSLPSRAPRNALGALLFAWGLLLGWPGGGVSPAQASPDEDAAWIGGLHRQVETILHGPAEAEAERTRRLEALVLEGFDLPALGTFALGRHARDAAPEEIARYRDLFDGFALRSYTRYLAGADGRPFYVDRGRPLGADESLVKTRLGLANDEDLEVVWRVRRSAGDHKIVDLYVEGVSMALTLRQEFGAVIGSGGMDGLLDSLRGETGGEPAFRSTGKATRFLLQSQLGRFGGLPAGPR